MATDLLAKELPGVDEDEGRDATTEDLDQLVSQLDAIDARCSRTFLASMLSTVTALALNLNLAIWSLSDRVGWMYDLSRLLSFLLTPAALAYALESSVERSRLARTRLEFARLLRVVAPALLHRGVISHLRWKTIRIILSRYGI